MFLDVLLITIVLLSIGFTGMALTILVKKKGKFPEFRVGHNSDMTRIGVNCVKHQEIRCHKKMLKKRNDSACGSCQPLG